METVPPFPEDEVGDDVQGACKLPPFLKGLKIDVVIAKPGHIETHSSFSYPSFPKFFKKLGRKKTG